VISTVCTDRGGTLAPRFLCQLCADSGEKKVYRGHEKRTRTGFIIGHEFTGTILSVGSGVQKFTPGDKVVSPFTRYPRSPPTIKKVLRRIVPVGNVSIV